MATPNAALRTGTKGETSCFEERLSGVTALEFPLGLAVPRCERPQDYSAIARNIIPSGQKGTPPLDTTQAVMYDALTRSSTTSAP